MEPLTFSKSSVVIAGLDIPLKDKVPLVAGRATLIFRDRKQYFILL